MSIIAAGTTTTTALSSTGNTDGTLQFQVNGTTASVTLNTLGAVGVGSSPNYGTSGQVLTSGGATVAPAWATPAVTSPAGSTGQIQYNNAGAFGAVSSGSSGQVLTSQGSGAAPTWASPAAGGFSNMDVFTASGSWSVPAGITKCKVTVVGGGGGGDNDGGGGGGGGTAIKIVSGLTPGASITVTIGAGGAANSGNGGTTSFGAYCSASGGTNPTNNDRGGIGGIGSSGDLNIRGGDGLRYNNDTSGLRLSAGGCTYLGGGPATNTAATAGGNYGTGGAGNAAGASGVVVIEY